MLHRLTRIIRDLVVHPERMTENLNHLKGLIYSQQVLIKLASKGLQRQTAYELVQRNALMVWEKGSDFKELLLEDEELKKNLNEKEIEEIFNLDYHLKHVEDIFKRVFP